MKKFLLLSIVLFVSCVVEKRISETESGTYKCSINLKSEDEVFHLRGLFFINADSSYFNIFGPLGINLAKIRIKNDSLTFIDIQNKIIYISYYQSISKIVKNIFFNNLSDNEKNFLYDLGGYIDRNGSNEKINYNKNDNKVKYSFSGNKMKRIDILVKGSLVNYSVSVKYSPDINNYHFKLDKYKDYKIISINLR